jgi:hypothetical protein
VAAAGVDAGYGWRVARQANLRATWSKVLRDPAALARRWCCWLFLA